MNESSDNKVTEWITYYSNTTQNESLVSVSTIPFKHSPPSIVKLPKKPENNRLWNGLQMSQNNPPSNVP